MSGVLLEKRKGARKWPVKLESGEVEYVYGSHLSVQGIVAARPPKRKNTKTAKTSLQPRSNSPVATAAARVGDVQGSLCPSASDCGLPHQHLLSDYGRQTPQNRSVPREENCAGKFALQLDNSPPSIQVITSGKYQGAKWLCNSPVTASTYPTPAFLGPVVDTETGPTSQLRLDHDAPSLEFFQKFSPQHFLRDVVVKQCNLYAKQQGFGETKYPAFKTVEL